MVFIAVPYLFCTVAFCAVYGATAIISSVVKLLVGG